MKKTSEKNLADIIIFTDGASSGNPGPGGWGSIVAMLGEKESRVAELGGGEARTTNNRMELAAAIGGLEHVAAMAGTVIVYTDSKYVRDGIEKWVPVWQKRGWKTTAKADVLNRDLWEKLFEVTNERKEKILWRLVGGHRDVPANERCDEIAVAFAKNTKLKLFSGALKEYSLDLLPFADMDAVEKSLTGLDKRSRSGSKSSSQKAYSYISMVGGKILVHKTWPECFARINGVSGARFKKALSGDDEKRISAEFKSL